MPTLLEVLAPDGSWRPAGPPVWPGPPGSISHNPPDGPREVYLFGPADDDSHSVVFRTASDGVLEGDDGVVRVLGWKPARLSEVAQLGPGETFELVVQTDVSAVPRRVRLRHA